MNSHEALTVTRAFVDSITDDVATLIFGDRLARVPRSLLPDGVGEGSWVELTIREIAEPPDVAAQRRRRKALTTDDDGGDFEL